MALDLYRKKRDFGQTLEPKGERSAERRASPRRKKLAYVVQKHAASRLHYDFRLEHDGVLLSWAVPKGPSLDPTHKRLAVHVEDHPLEYGRFEGVIPSGQYGAGNVIVWDRGTWMPEGDVGAALRKGHLRFELDGEKLRGGFSLVRIGGREGDDKNWLLIKSRDAEARSHDAVDVVAEKSASVVSGREVEDVSADGRRVRKWASNRRANAKRSMKASERKPATATKAAHAKTERRAKTARSRPRPAREATIRAAKQPLPMFVAPMLPTLVESAPVGDEWLHETKFDGYRTLCRIDGERVTWLTRSGLDWSARFAALTPAMRALHGRRLLIDGEIVAFGAGDRVDFQALQRAFESPGEARLVYFAFDLLHSDGRDLRGEPLEARKELLAKLLKKAPAHVRISEHVRGEGRTVHSAACDATLEGIVSKRADSTYSSGRTREWVKVKCTRRQELVVGGWTEPSGARTDFGALLVGYHDESGALRYAGRVGTGFDRATLASVLQRLREVREPRFSDPPRGAEARGVHWTKPNVVVEIRFGSWTADGRLRHAAFQGLREDKRARDVIREQPMRRVTKKAMREATEKASRVKANARARSTARVARPRRTSPTRSRAAGKKPPKRAHRVTDASADTVQGIRITHPERVIANPPGITKLEVALYYERVAERLLPHVARRPLSLVRCPEGVTGECFFQRHRTSGLREDVREIDDPMTKRSYLWVDSPKGLIALVQMGVLELHPWGSRIDDLERPDRLVLDLDPDPSVPWQRVVETGRLVRALLEKLGLESFAMVTGGKGLHVIVPLARKQGWDEVKSFARGLADTIARQAPDRYLSRASKAARRGRIFLDWLRNGRAATAVAPYSTRARADLPVAVPVAWEELARVRSSDAFGVEETLRRLAAKRLDPWAEYGATRQTISASALASVAAR